MTNEAYGPLTSRAKLWWFVAGLVISPVTFWVTSIVGSAAELEDLSSWVAFWLGSVVSVLGTAWLWRRDAAPGAIACFAIGSLLGVPATFCSILIAFMVNPPYA